MDGSTVIALLALVVSIGFGLYNALAIRLERHDRREQLDLYRRQVKAETEQHEMAARDREAQRHAEITAAQGGYSRRSGSGDYDFTLKNLGPSWAKHIACWLADSTEEPLTPKVRAQYLEPGQERTVTLQVPERLWLNSVPFHLMIEWRDDGGGPHVERSNLQITL